MRFLGLEIKRAGTLSAVPGGRGWWPLSVREPFAGAWQRNIEWSPETVLAHHAVYSCVTLVANDLGKLRTRLVEKTPDDIWVEVESPAFSPVLRRPNRNQNHIQFKEWWITSKLTTGNAYGLKSRDNRGVVDAIYVLDPKQVTPLVAADGSVFYRLGKDDLNQLGEEVTVPASEIIHDRMNCLFHPLVGVSPLFAAGLAASQGLRMQNDSARFFENGANPGGILTAPGNISEGTAASLKEHWQNNYSGNNSGRVAVVGDGLKFEPMKMTAIDSQLIEQLKWSAEIVCGVFRVPGYKVGVGQQPLNNNVEALDAQYYSQCLQSLIEEFEACMDHGLGLEKPVDGRRLGVELDLEGLMRMDTVAKTDAVARAIGAGFMSPNEGRKAFNLAPVIGGDSPYLQQQNWSLSDLAMRGPAPSESRSDTKQLADVLTTLERAAIGLQRRTRPTEDQRMLVGMISKDA